MAESGYQINISGSDSGSFYPIGHTSFVDVICHHSCDGEIIPLRIHAKDDDGEYHSFTIKSYKSLSHRRSYVTTEGVFVTNNILNFDCHIIVLGVLQTVRLYYVLATGLWRMSSLG